MLKANKSCGIAAAALTAIISVVAPAAAGAKGTATLGVTATVMACHSYAISSLGGSNKASIRSGSAAATVTQTCPVGLSWSASIDEPGTSLADIQGRGVRASMGTGADKTFQAIFTQLGDQSGSAPRVVTITY